LFILGKKECLINISNNSYRLSKRVKLKNDLGTRKSVDIIMGTYKIIDIAEVYEKSFSDAEKTVRKNYT